MRTRWTLYHQHHHEPSFQQDKCHKILYLALITYLWFKTALFCTIKAYFSPWTIFSSTVSHPPSHHVSVCVRILFKYSRICWLIHFPFTFSSCMLLTWMFVLMGSINVSFELLTSHYERSKPVFSWIRENSCKFMLKW